jgi:Flp pilus assembly protein TadD
MSLGVMLIASFLWRISGDALSGDARYATWIPEPVPTGNAAEKRDFAAKCYAKGRQLAREGNNHLALEAFTAAITAHPDMEVAYRSRARTLSALEREREAEADTVKAESLRRSSADKINQ